ncbi:MAG TPA: adenylyltransferase/cytidyltransferase family protein [Azospirillaceae bacterium]|nr:adenylyltransferase/cytidyltransferase family protein [Azospirillaceae bacterium]
MRIYTKIVGDLFHPGHVAFLAAARALGTHLTVCVVPDERVALVKRRPIMTTDERVAVVAACRHVDRVVTDGPREITRAFLDANGLDLYAYGAVDEAEAAVKLADCADLPPARRVRLPYMPGISTSDLIDRVLRRAAGQ